MQIHELNNFNGTPGATNFLAIDNGSDTARISGEALLGPVNGRIDNLTANMLPDSVETILDWADVESASKTLTKNVSGFDYLDLYFKEVTSGTNRIVFAQRYPRTAFPAQVTIPVISWGGGTDPKYLYFQDLMIAISGTTLTMSQLRIYSWDGKAADGANIEAGILVDQIRVDGVKISSNTSAELTDLRTAHNGTVYASARAAREADYNALDSEIQPLRNDIDNAILFSLADFPCERGAYSSAGVYDDSNPTRRIRVINAIRVKAGDYFVTSSDSYTNFAVVFTPEIIETPTDTGWIAAGDMWVAPSDGYARITIKKTNGEVITDEEVNTYRENVVGHISYFDRIGTDGIKRIKESIELNNAGFEYFDPTIFQIGGMSSGVINGSAYRIVTTNIQLFDRPIRIKSIEGNIRFGVHTYDSNDTFVADSGWQTDYIVPANTKFRMVVQKNPDYNVRLSGLVEAISRKVAYSTSVQSEIEILKSKTNENYDYFYPGEGLDYKKHGYWATNTWHGMGPNPTGKSAQGMAIYNGVIFQLFNPDYVRLRTFPGFVDIAEYSITSEHGDTAEFSNEFYDSSDEFPLLYITSDSDPAKVFVNRVTRSGATLIRTYYFGDLTKTGYYAGHCCDFDNNIMYLVGYTEGSYYADPNKTNKMIVSKWDLSNIHDNGDGTITPAFLGSFTVPFISTAQGQRFFRDKIYILSSKNGVDGVVGDTKIYVIDPYKQKIDHVFTEFPQWIKEHEGEGIEFVLNDDGTAWDMWVSDGYYFKLNFY